MTDTDLAFLGVYRDVPMRGPTRDGRLVIRLCTPKGRVRDVGINAVELARMVAQASDLLFNEVRKACSETGGAT